MQYRTTTDKKVMHTLVKENQGQRTIHLELADGRHVVAAHLQAIH